MRTALEIARQHVALAGYDPNDSIAQALVVGAIEADRAERQARLEDLHAYEHLGQDAVPTSIIVQIDTPENVGRMRVYINDDRIYDGIPETGQEFPA